MKIKVIPKICMQHFLFFLNYMEFLKGSYKSKIWIFFRNSIGPDPTCFHWFLYRTDSVQWKYERVGSGRPFNFYTGRGRTKIIYIQAGPGNARPYRPLSWLKSFHFLNYFYFYSYCCYFFLFRLVPAVAAFTASIICSKIPGLTPAQQRMCQERPDLIVAVGDGARMGIAECQKQFRLKRWNCTAIGSSYVFGHVVVVGKYYLKYLKCLKKKIMKENKIKSRD